MHYQCHWPVDKASWRTLVLVNLFYSVQCKSNQHNGICLGCANLKKNQIHFYFIFLQSVKMQGKNLLAKIKKKYISINCHNMNDLVPCYVVTCKHSPWWPQSSQLSQSQYHDISINYHNVNDILPCFVTSKHSPWRLTIWWYCNQPPHPGYSILSNAMFKPTRLKYIYLSIDCHNVTPMMLCHF